MTNVPQLAPEEQFPKEAIRESIQKQPTAVNPFQGGFLTIGLASVADQITTWGKNTKRRDQQLRDFWPTESYLAGAVATVSFRNAAFDWQIKGGSDRVNQAVTDMLNHAIAGDKVGWTEFARKFSQDGYTQDNGMFIELIRDPGIDANSKFKGERAPVIGIATLDSGQCIRTGNIETPVLYEDRDGNLHKMKWYEVIPFSDFPSAIEKMNGVGYCAVTRALRLAQIMRSIAFPGHNQNPREVTQGQPSPRKRVFRGQVTQEWNVQYNGYFPCYLIFQWCVQVRPRSVCGQHPHRS